MGRKSLYKLRMYITDNCVHNSRNRLLQHILSQECPHNENMEQRAGTEHADGILDI